MNIVGYIVQTSHQEKMQPNAGYKRLICTYSHALQFAKEKAEEYLQNDTLARHPQPFELKSPAKRDVDAYGYAMVFQNTEYQIWIEVIIK